MQIRPWSLDDAPALVGCRASHPDLERQLPPLPDAVVARSWLRDRQRDPFGVFLAVVVDDVAVGQVAISYLDPRMGTGWFSYWLRAEVRGRGLAAPAAASVADWGLGELGLHRLELGHRTDNPASGRVAEQAGFVVEGLEREKLCYDGIRHDVRTMARLAGDPRPDHQPVPLRAEPPAGWPLPPRTLPGAPGAPGAPGVPGVPGGQGAE